MGINWHIWPNQCLEPGQNFTRLGVAAFRFLRVQLFAIDHHFKSAFAASDEGQFLYNVLIMGQNVIRRTDGSFAVVSRNTILNRNHKPFFHKTLLCHI